jgi:hypothetical protein
MYYTMGAAGSKVLVDLDNLSFKVSDVQDYQCLMRRLHNIVKYGNVTMFCNEATRSFMAANGFPDMAKLVFTNNIQDGADHLLLHAFRCHHRSGTKVIVVTADKTLARLVRYFCTRPKDLAFCLIKSDNVYVNNRKIDKKNSTTTGCSTAFKMHSADRFGLVFNDKEDLDKFVTSRDLYESRATAGDLDAACP